MKKQFSPIRQGVKQRRGPPVGLQPDRYYKNQEPQAVPARGGPMVSYPLLNAVDGGRSVKPGPGVGSKIEVSKKPDEINRANQLQRSYASWRVGAVHENPTEATSGSPKPQRRAEAPARYGDVLLPPKKDATSRSGEQRLKGTTSPDFDFEGNRRRGRRYFGEWQ